MTSVLPASAFWLASLLLAMAYAGYPLVIAVLGSLRPRPVRKSSIRPTVTILIAAYNEGANLARKLENCLTLIYPPHLLDVVVASDGSTDDTWEIARSS